MQISARSSPNFGPRRPPGTQPDMVILHYTAMEDCCAALRVLCDPQREVSAHYVLGLDGLVTQLVDEDQRAWHAGASGWGRVTDVNSHSIGIEISNTGFAPFAPAQMRALDTLLADIMTRRAIPPERVLGHSDIAPGRKIDPGRFFDWNRLAVKGLAVRAHATRPSPPDLQHFIALLHRIGYPSADDAALLHSFRLRHRSGFDGPLDAYDMALADDMAARFPLTDTI